MLPIQITKAAAVADVTVLVIAIAVPVMLTISEEFPRTTKLRTTMNLLVLLLLSGVILLLEMTSMKMRMM
jgi:hypothetical protein